MRVIAGEARRLQLKTPKGTGTRPTSDKTKETLFNVLAPYIYSDTRFLDLFAGSGGIGIEAVSRGAEAAVLVERDREAARCIEENIRTCRFEDRCRLMKTDVISALGILEKRAKKPEERFDMIFMDPPYSEGYEKKVLKLIAKGNLLGEEAVIIAESAADTDFSFVNDLGLEIFKEKDYLNNKHVFFRRAV
ncbi:MAG: 16S rRNA (guanine(966)-N(2))-methyltransferase RsmD [Lachnospiraceae bacterium]|nr:16S rRNA (guanine(966)-N(2))-methyltransferase RsmD [Lachnospiraceae bacterium]